MHIYISGSARPHARAGAEDNTGPVQIRKKKMMDCSREKVGGAK